MARRGHLRFLDTREHGVRDDVDIDHAWPSRSNAKECVVDSLPEVSPEHGERKRERSLGSDATECGGTTASLRGDPATPSVTMPRGSEIPSRSDDASVDDASKARHSIAVSHSHAARVEVAPMACADLDVGARDSRSLTVGIRGWIEELREFQRAVKDDTVNDESARLEVEGFLARHLSKSESVVGNMLSVRQSLQAEARAAIDRSSASALAREASARDAGEQGTRVMRKLQQFDMEAFAILSEIFERQTQRFFNPLCRVSAGMFTNWLKQRFHTGAWEADDVDWHALGRSTYGLGKDLGGIGLRGIGESMVGHVNLGVAGSNQSVGETTALVRLRLASREGATNGKDESAGGKDRGTKRRGPLGPLQRPDIVVDATDRDRKAAQREAYRRMGALSRALRAEGPRDLIDCFFDSSSFCKSVESLLDVATMVADGQAAIDAPGVGVDVDNQGGAEQGHSGGNKNGVTTTLRKTTRKTGCTVSVAEGDARGAREDRPEDNSTFVLQFDLKTWKAMGGLAPEEDETSPDEIEAAPYVMPIDADPYDALLEGDTRRAAAALDRLRLGSRERAVCAGIAYIYREAFLSEAFFKEWSSDLLMTIWLFSDAAPGGPSRELSTRAARRVAQHWLDLNGEMPINARSEDVLFYNQGLFVLSRMNVAHDRLRAQISEHAARFTSHWYHRLDPTKPETYRRPGDEDKSTSFDKLSSALIWSFFLEATGLQNEITGATAEDIRRLCETEVNMRHDHTVEELRALPDFESQCYFVTHKVFTYTEWCRRWLRSEEWTEERDFLLAHLRHTWATLGDVHLCGEFVQTLRCFGDKESNNREVRDAVKFIMKSQDASTGGWQVDAADFRNSYHATVCAVGALMSPLIEGTVDKVCTVEFGRGSARQREALARKKKEMAGRAAVVKKYSWERPQEEAPPVAKRTRARAAEAAANRGEDDGSARGGKQRRTNRTR